MAKDAAVDVIHEILAAFDSLGGRVDPAIGEGAHSRTAEGTPADGGGDGNDQDNPSTSIVIPAIRFTR